MVDHNSYLSSDNNSSQDSKQKMSNSKYFFENDSDN